MAQKAFYGSQPISEQIRHRRQELGLTIGAAASRAGVNAGTWCRYESGQPIRWDKRAGVCRALAWNHLPLPGERMDLGLSPDEYREGDAWSPILEQAFGVRAAMSFAVGSDMLLDRINADLRRLNFMPVGTSIGELDLTDLSKDLPKQFIQSYDYTFLFHMRCALLILRGRARSGLPMIAHTVMEQLLLYLCADAASNLIAMLGIKDAPEAQTFAYSKAWLFTLFGNSDLLTNLYSTATLPPDHPYHFSHWEEEQFFME